MPDSTALVPVPAPACAALAPAARRAQEYFRAAQAENTRRAYASDWKHFSAWCRAAGQGRRVGLPYGSTPATCPVRALEAWLAVLGADEGPLFRAINRHGQLAGRRLTAQSVALVIKRLAAQAGMEVKDLAGHSLRAGLATAAAAAGVPERAIMAQTGHRSLGTLRKYIREGSRFFV
jgi:integrase